MASGNVSHFRGEWLHHYGVTLFFWTALGLFDVRLSLPIMRACQVKGTQINPTEKENVFRICRMYSTPEDLQFSLQIWQNDSKDLSKHFLET